MFPKLNQFQTCMYQFISTQVLVKSCILKWKCQNKDQAHSRTAEELIQRTASVLEKTTVRLSDADATKWPSTSPSFRTWCLRAVHWPESPTSWQYYAWLCLIWSPWEALATHPQTAPISPPFLRNRSGFQFCFIQWNLQGCKKKKKYLPPSWYLFFAYLSYTKV